MTADESYIRESIVTPAAKVVAGYQPIMPTYQGLVTEEGIMQLIAYIQTIGASPIGPSAPATSSPQPGPSPR
jgi:cytochrome c oxidase subunit 2